MQYINVYPDTLNDFPSWLSTSKNQPFFINNRGKVDILGIGNPAAQRSVKQYLTLVHEDQAKARVCKKRAIPIFFAKFPKLCLYLRGSVFFRVHLLFISMQEI